MTIVYEAPAEQELASAARYYAHISAALAERFVVEFDAAAARILERPKAWPPLSKGFRRCLLTDFPYQIVYKSDGEIIRVYAVAHLSRRPNYWRKRET